MSSIVIAWIEANGVWMWKVWSMTHIIIIVCWCLILKEVVEQSWIMVGKDCLTLWHDVGWSIVLWWNTDYCWYNDCKFQRVPWMLNKACERPKVLFVFVFWWNMWILKNKKE